MKAALLWQPVAEDDFLFVFELIHDEQPAAAERWFASVLKSTELLMDFPRMGKLLWGGKTSGIRRLSLGNYLLLYRTIPSDNHSDVQQIVILRILDGRMEPKVLRALLSR